MRPRTDSPTGQPSSLTRGAFVLLTSFVGTNALGLLSGVALARGLGAEQRGVMQYAVLFFAVVPLVLGLSLGTVFATYGRGQPVPIRGFWPFAAGTSGVAALGAVALVSVGVPLPAALILAGGSIGYMTSDALVGLATRSERFQAVANIRWVNLGGNSVLVLALYATGTLTVTTGVATLVLTTALVTGIGWVRQPRPARQTLLWSVRGHVARVHGVRLSATASTYLDQLIVAVSMTSSVLGVYTVALSLARQINVIPAALQTVVLEAARRDEHDGRHRLEPLISALLWMGVVAATIAALVGQSFFAILFGEEFREAGNYAAALLITGTVAGVLILVEAYLTGMHRPGVALRARLWSAPAVVAACAAAVATQSVWLSIGVSGITSVVPLVLCFQHLRRADRVRIAPCLRPPTIRSVGLLVHGLRR